MTTVFTPTATPSDCYHHWNGKHLVRSADDLKPQDLLLRLVHHQFREMILAPEYSCMGAKSAVNSNSYRFGWYRSIDSDQPVNNLARDLTVFLQEQARHDWKMSTYIAAFQGPHPRDEQQFETWVWERLQDLHDRDTCAWDPSVSDEPTDPRFSFSFGGSAFFVLGMAPCASRWARRFSLPVLVFNAHRQFEWLRETGRYTKFKNAIRSAEMRLQGSLNPNLADFGDASEACQYSGRAAEADWQAPLIVRQNPRED